MGSEKISKATLLLQCQKAFLSFRTSAYPDEHAWYLAARSIAEYMLDLCYECRDMHACMIDCCREKVAQYRWLQEQGVTMSGLPPVVT